MNFFEKLTVGFGAFSTIVAFGIFATLFHIMWSHREIPSCEPQCVTCEPESCRQTFRQKYFHGGSGTDTP